MSIRHAGRTALAVLAAAIVGAGSAGTAHAAAPWIAGPTYGAGNLSFPGDLAVSPDGATTAVWTELTDRDAGRSTGYAQRTPGGAAALPAVPVSPADSFSVSLLAEPSTNGSTVTLAVDYNDGADDQDDTLRLTTIAADGSVAGSIVVAGEIDRLQEYGTKLAVDDAGNALVTWIAGSGGDRRLYARRIAADGTFGPVLQLEVVSSNAMPQVAFAPDGTARVVWVGNGLAVQVTVARLTTTGHLDGALERLSPPGVPTQAPALSASAAGVAVSWIQGGGSQRELHTARLPTTGPVAGAFQLIADDVVSEIPEAAATVLLADDGSLVAAWSVQGGGESTAYPLQTQMIAPDGARSPVRVLSVEPPASIIEGFPRLLPVNDGSYYAVWVRMEFGELGASELRGREIAADGTLGAATVVTDAIHPGPDVPFTASTDALGNLFVGWITASTDDPGASFATATLRRVAPVVPEPETGNPTPDVPIAPPVTSTPPAISPAPAPSTSRAPAARKVSAALRIAKLTRKGMRVTVTGRLDRRASGRVKVVWSQRVGRKTLKRTVRAKITRGRFTARLRLPRTLAAARTSATVTVSYAGDGDTRAATGHKRVARRAKGLAT